jgi:hypothetical protein
MSEKQIPEKDRPKGFEDSFDETEWALMYNYEYVYYRKRKDRTLTAEQFGIFGDVKFEEATIAKMFENLQFFKHYNEYLKERLEWVTLTEEESLQRIEEIDFKRLYFFPPDHGLKLIKFLTEKRDIFTSPKDKKYFQWVTDNCDILDAMYIKQNCRKHVDYIGRSVMFEEEDRGTIDVVMEINELNEPCPDDLAIRAELCFNNKYGYNTFALMFFPWNFHIFTIPHIKLTVSFITTMPELNYQYIMWGNMFMTLFVHQQDFWNTVTRFEITLRDHYLSLYDKEADMIFM